MVVVVVLVCMVVMVVVHDGHERGRWVVRFAYSEVVIVMMKGEDESERMW